MPAARRGDTALRATLVVMGLITATPALALVDGHALEWTYGVADPEPMTEALLQHRGMLQLLLGAALVWAAFFRPARPAAALAAVVGKGAFLLLLLPDPALRADLAPFSTVFDLSCIVLLTALGAHRLHRSHRARATSPAEAA
ncbi:hypothetical protein [Streptomyces sp. MP131-18]|uniref:hypothetical protein n=1 Tax=Streptomyces sp. MP131-18 TaxID=1857892 RepID=UPI00097BE4D0|nr:hypothetical protein [Streptomyces sp. MP131-18]ONK13511.1 hypothetical protein STBA_42800 [Streptomyces sp. MP131-18]